MTALSLYIPNMKAIKDKTLIIMDEIQECSNARSSLRSFVLDSRYDVLATGSLLGLKGYNRNPGQGPSVGQETIIEMTSMDFEEYLWAKGVQKSVLDLLKKSYINHESIPESIHEVMLKYFREYLVIGGMPEVVDTFMITKNFSEARKKQCNLIQSYRNDFGKYLSEKGEEIIDKSLLLKLNRIIDTLPLQLAKEYKKFQYSLVDKNAKADRYYDAIQWLFDYGLLVPCYNLKCFDLPLDGSYIKDEFKLYFSDVGLFMSQLEEGTAADVIQNNLGIYKGALYEELIADAFYKNRRKLYYYRKESGLEIDFVTRYQGKVTLIEVKAKNGRTKASNTILSNPKYNVNSLVKLTASNIGYLENKLTLPYYLSYLLREY